MEIGALKGLLWLVIVGALFYFVMRKGGCCGHSGGGHSKDKEHPHGEADSGSKKKTGCC